MGGSWEALGRIPGKTTRHIAGKVRLAARLLRYEVKALVEISPDRLVASVREGLFYYDGTTWNRAHVAPCGNRPARSPMRILASAAGEVVWGEYGRNMERSDVAIYRSTDGGATYTPLHTFPPGEVRHIHNVMPHESGQGYWVLAGDYGDEPGIGILSQDGETMEWIGRGAQSYRAVHVFDQGDTLLYATDTELETNRVLSLHKETGETRALQTLPGSCLHGCTFGDVLTVSTSVETSPVNPSKDAELWCSRDGENWTRLCTRRKDHWHNLAFQFGSLILPTGRAPEGPIVFSAQSLRGWDNQVFQIHA